MFRLLFVTPRIAFTELISAITGMRHDVFKEPGRDAVQDDLATWAHRQLRGGPARVSDSKLTL
jgi:hypothetical protein